MENTPSGRPQALTLSRMTWPTSALVPGMRGVRLHDDGIAGGEGRSGISAGDGKSQGKIAGAKDRDRAERLVHGADGRLGQRLAVGVGVVDARV